MSPNKHRESSIFWLAANSRACYDSLGWGCLAAGQTAWNSRVKALALLMIWNVYDYPFEFWYILCLCIEYHQSINRFQSVSARTCVYTEAARGAIKTGRRQRLSSVYRTHRAHSHRAASSALPLLPSLLTKVNTITTLKFFDMELSCSKECRSYTLFQLYVNVNVNTHAIVGNNIELRLQLWTLPPPSLELAWE